MGEFEIRKTKKKKKKKKKNHWKNSRIFLNCIDDNLIINSTPTNIILGPCKIVGKRPP